MKRKIDWDIFLMASGLLVCACALHTAFSFMLNFEHVNINNYSGYPISSKEYLPIIYSISINVLYLLYVIITKRINRWNKTTKVSFILYSIFYILFIVVTILYVTKKTELVILADDAFACDLLNALFVNNEDNQFPFLQFYICLVSCNFLLLSIAFIQSVIFKNES